MDRHCENANILVEFLRNHPKVEKLYFPGNSDYIEDNKIMHKQMKKPGGVISLSVKGTKETAQFFMNQLQLVKIAVSLGDAETLIQHPATMTHAAIPEEERRKMGIDDTLLRLSVGLEAWEDIQEDLEQALEKI
jgi:methionine-gamma-lyase